MDSAIDTLDNRIIEMNMTMQEPVTKSAASAAAAKESANAAAASAAAAKNDAKKAEDAADRAVAVAGFTIDTSLNENSPNPVTNKATTKGIIQTGESGARNLVPFPYYEKAGTENGITWTVNDDGTIGISGTATANVSFIIRATSEKWTVRKGTYTLSGCPSGGSFSGYRLQLARFIDGTLTSYANEYGTGATFEITDDLPLLLQFVITSGVTIDATVAPMLERGGVKHSFVPFYFGSAEKAKTAENATNAAAVNGFKIYNSITQLGISSYNIPSIVKAMPSGSMFVDHNATDNEKYDLETANNNLPYGAGTIEIVKPNTNLGKTVVMFMSGVNSSKTALYLCDLDETNWVVNGWKHVGDGGNADKLDGYDASDFLKTNGGGTVSFDNYTDFKVKRNNDSHAAGVCLAFANNNGTVGMVGFKNHKMIRVNPANGWAEYEVFDTSNKPSGTYTGVDPGLASSIQIGESGKTIGSLLYIETEDGFGLICATGGVYFGPQSANQYQHFHDTDISYVDGILEIMSGEASSIFNRSGVVYKYSLL